MATPFRRPETYGADPTGLVWAFRFEADGSARAIESEEAAEALASTDGPARGTFLWLHFSLASAASEQWLRSHVELPAAFYDSLTHSAGSTRLEQDDEALVGVLHDVLFDFTFDPASVSTVNLCVRANVLVTARPRPLRSVDRLRSRVRAGYRFRSPAELLAHLLQEQAGVLVEIIRDATERTDALEDRVLQSRLPATRGQLGEMRRTLVRLQRLLVPEPAALFRLLNRPPAWLAEDDLDDLRAAAEEFSAALGDSAALVERVKLLQEEVAAFINEQTNRTLFLLTLVTVLALPVNLTAGLLGMNVRGIPFADDHHGFAIVTSTLLTATAFAGVLIFWRRRG